jgi:two-component system, sensor histidine kinase and response regulator
MTIAKRLIVLLVVPLLAFTSLGVFNWIEVTNVEERSLSISEDQIPSLATLGNLTRSYADVRVAVRNDLLATNDVGRASARAAFDKSGAEVNQLLDQYNGKLLSDDQDRRLFNDYRELSRANLDGDRQVMALVDQGRHDEAVALMAGTVSKIGDQLSETASRWIQHNEELASAAGKSAVDSVHAYRRNMVIAVVLALALSGWLGLLTFRRIVNPIRGLEQSVNAIAKGDYAKEVPFTQAADETGGLARSIDVLKRGAAAMDEQRWVKASTAKITAELQGAGSFAEFGQRLVSGLVPLLDGGVAGVYLFEENPPRLRRIATYGLADGTTDGDTIKPGEGLVGQCAQERKPVTLANLPPGYLRIASGLGAAAPVQAVAWPLSSGEMLLGVFEFASFRALTAREQALLDELLPVAGMNLEILQRNLRTQELLEQVKTTEERTRLILESSAEGIFGTDTDGSITFVNPAACRMLGFNAEELIGKPSHAAFHHHRPDGSDYPKEECPMFAAYKHGKASRIDNEFLWRKDGVGLPVEYGATPILKDGMVIGSVVSFTDITERKQQEAELQRQQNELQQINFKADSALDLTKAGYWHIPLDGSGWYNSSERAVRIFGDPPAPEHRYTLAHWMDHVRLGDEAAAKTTAENFEAAVTGKIPVYDAVYAYQRPVDGRIVWIHALGHVVKDANGKPTDMFGVTQDITDFKLLEREIVGAKQKAEEATQMKSMFLANMSHEIRTPMNAIIGLSHLALKTQLTPKQRDYVSKVHNAGTSLLAVINDILDFSKIEAGKLDLETTDFKLDEVITSVTTLTAQKAHEKGLEFLAHVAPGIPEFLLGDPLRLGQILTNFVNNAVKFTEKGEIRLEIGQVERTGEKVQLKFSVRDSGIGMTKEQSARLFQPFTQADMSTTRKHGGTGLGLTISRRLVELMGGRIWLESEPGVGSTFNFTVWLGIGAAKGSGKIIPERIAKLRVLVVDDNSTAREILQEPLSNVVHRVDTVASGLEAITAVKQQDAAEPYDILFMDWRMPGMDGLQASRHIKSDETLAHPPHIVLVTAFGREEVREEAERLQLDGFLVKPVTKSMIVDTLVNVFSDAGKEIAATVEDAHAARLHGARILLTEDNDINQQIAVELLEGAGATVKVANNGRVAVDILSNGPQPPPFDVVLMDLQMPEMDGYQATAKLRADPRFKELPIIAMTAHATIEERQRCLASGMNDHISKPIDPANLFETVGKYYKPVAQTSQSAVAQVSKPAGGEKQTAPANPRQPAGWETGDTAGLETCATIDGLDAKDGLTRVAGNKRLYVKLLRQFAEQQGPMVGQVSDALARGDTALAERLAHTLKGVAGNIGAKSVQLAAGDLEKLIRGQAKADEVKSASRKVSAALDPLLSRLQAALASASPPPAAAPAAATPVNPAQSREAAAQLGKLLAEFDPGAADFVEANQAALHPLFAGETWTQFEKAVQNYSFAEAQGQLDQAQKNFTAT